MQSSHFSICAADCRFRLEEVRNGASATIRCNCAITEKAKGWTLEQLAGQVGVSRETIGKIERGVAAPLFETAEKIAMVLDVPAPVLFGATPCPVRASGHGC